MRFPPCQEQLYVDTPIPIASIYQGHADTQKTKKRNPDLDPVLAENPIRPRFDFRVTPDTLR